MIYFDNAASGGYKPDCVKNAVLETLNNSANPGRSGHKAASAAALKISQARENAASFFGLGKNGNIIFTHNCTTSLNYAILGGIHCGHVVTTALEHNSVLRPLHYLNKRGNISFTVVYPDSSGKIRAGSIINAVKRNTQMIIVNHISNVTGAKAPIEEIGAYTKKSGILFLVDAAQSAGHINIDMEKIGINILAAAGHKGLAAPQGVGILAVSRDIKLRPIILGGTGTQSESSIQPGDLPESLESGTVSTPAIAGLDAGLSWIKQNFSTINKNIYKLTKYLYEEIIKIPQVIVYTPQGEYNGLITFNIKGLFSGETANLLDEKFDICVRAGLHCAPLAHKFLGTITHGAVRASMSFQNSMEEVKTFLNAIREIVKNI